MIVRGAEQAIKEAEASLQACKRLMEEIDLSPSEREAYLNAHPERRAEAIATLKQELAAELDSPRHMSSGTPSSRRINSKLI